VSPIYWRHADKVSMMIRKISIGPPANHPILRILTTPECPNTLIKHQLMG
jgi:hypothetical protein